MLKVLVIASVYPRFEKDTEVPWLRTSIAKLSEQIHVEVLAPAYQGLKSHTIDGVKVHRFRYATQSLEILTHDEGAPSKMANRPWMQLLAIPYVISGMFQCFRLLRQQKFDCLHVHWPFPHALISFIPSKIFKVPVILNFHGAELLLVKKHPWVRFPLRFAIKHSQATLANSSFTAKKIHDIKATPVILSPYGTTLSSSHLLESKPKLSSPFKVLFVGRHIERKGLTYLIQAAAMLDPEQYSIRIVGGGDLTAELQKQAQSLELSHVHFLGKLSKEDLTKEYLNANAFVLPAIVDSKGDTEGLGVVLIEAIEYDLPVIASNVGGIPDVIVDQKTGLLVQEKNASALKLAIESLATNQNLQNHLTKNAYEHVQKHFSWDIIVQKQIELYQNLSTKD